MDSILEADIVISTAGREKGKPFLVYAVTESEVLLIDGKYRRIENPKRKNVKHVRLVARPDTRVAAKIKAGEHFTNSEVRKELAAYLEPETAAL